MKKPKIHLTSYDQIFNQHSRDNIASPRQGSIPLTLQKIRSKKSNEKGGAPLTSRDNKNILCSRQNHQKSIQLENTKISLNQKQVKSKQKKPACKYQMSMNKNKKKVFNENCSVTISSALDNYNSFLQQITKILLNNIKINDPTSLLSHRISYIQFLQCMKQLKMIKNDYDPMDRTGAQSELVSQFWNKLIAKNNVANFINTIGIVLGCTGKEQHTSDYWIHNKYAKLRQIRDRALEQQFFKQESCLKRVNTFGSQISKHQIVSVNLRIQSEENLLETQHNQKQDEGIQQPYSFRKEGSMTDRYNISFQARKLGLKNQQQQKSARQYQIHLSGNQTWRKNNFSNRQNKQNKCLLNYNGKSLSPLNKNIQSNYLIQTDRNKHNKSTIETKKRKVISKVTIKQKQGNHQFDKALLSQINHSINMHRDPAGNRRSELLYQLGRQKSQEKRQDKSTVDYEYQRNYKYLTFKPEINNYKQSKKKQFIDNLHIQKRVNGQQKAIKRLVKGRIDKQVRKIIVQRGLPNNSLTVRKLLEQQYQGLANCKKRKEKANSITSESTTHNQQAYREQFNKKLLNFADLNHQQIFKSRKQQNKVVAQQKPQRVVSSKPNHIKTKSAVVVPISIENQQFHLIVNEQQESLEEVAHRFLTEHNLNVEQNIENFIKEIEKSLKFSLDLIYQDQEFQNSEQNEAQ